MSERRDECADEVCVFHRWISLFSTVGIFIFGRILGGEFGFGIVDSSTVTGGFLTSSLFTQTVPIQFNSKILSPLNVPPSHTSTSPNPSPNHPIPFDNTPASSLACHRSRIPNPAHHHKRIGQMKENTNKHNIAVLHAG